MNYINNGLLYHAGVGLLHNLHNLIVKAMNMSFDGNILCDS
jgi:hypothetical protein